MRHPLMNPEGLKGPLKVSEMTDDEYEEAHLKMLFHIRQECVRTNRLLFDQSKPVNEEFNAPDPVPPGKYTIQPDYAMPVRINTIFASLPVGMTSALLELGRERQILLYSGGATTVQTVVNVQGLQIEMTDNDNRVITLAGAMTTGFFIHLGGYAYELYGNA